MKNNKKFMMAIIGLVIALALAVCTAVSAHVDNTAAIITEGTNTKSLSNTVIPVAALEEIPHDGTPIVCDYIRSIDGVEAPTGMWVASKAGTFPAYHTDGTEGFICVTTNSWWWYPA